MGRSPDGNGKLNNRGAIIKEFVGNNLFFIAFVTLFFAPVIKVVMPKGKILVNLCIWLVLYLLHAALVYVAYRLIGVGI